MHSRPLFLSAAIVGAFLRSPALVPTAVAQTDGSTAGPAASPAPAAGDAPSTGETGQPGTMGSSQPDTTDKAPAPPQAAPRAPADPSAAAIVMVPLDKNETPVPSLNLMVGQLDEMDVIGADGNEIGGVDHVLGDQQGAARAISVDVGGFLGLGEKTVILDLSDVTLDMGRLRTTLTKQQIEALPDFDG